MIQVAKVLAKGSLDHAIKKAKKVDDTGKPALIDVKQTYTQWYEG